MMKNSMIPVEGIIRLMEGYRLMHEQLFEDRRKNSQHSFAAQDALLEKSMDRMLTSYGLNPSDLHEFVADEEENGGSIAKAVQKYIDSVYVHLQQLKGGVLN